VILTLLDIILLACLFVSEYHSILGFADCRLDTRTNESPDSNQESRAFPGILSNDTAALVDKEHTSRLNEEERSKYAAVGIGIVSKYRRNRVLRDLDFTLAKQVFIVELHFNKHYLIVIAFKTRQSIPSTSRYPLLSYRRC